MDLKKLSTIYLPHELTIRKFTEYVADNKARTIIKNYFSHRQHLSTLQNQRLIKIVTSVFKVMHSNNAPLLMINFSILLYFIHFLSEIPVNKLAGLVLSQFFKGICNNNSFMDKHTTQ